MINEVCSGSIPRPEYPRPRFVRNSPWINLNGTWKFAFDPGRSAAERNMEKCQDGYDLEINVPFCPESILSGIGNTDFIEACAYSREITVPGEWNGFTPILHFDAVDYSCEVYVDGIKSAVHSGGGTGFSLPLPCGAGKHLVNVLVRDDVRSGKQGLGKQSHIYNSFGCDYTRITGIWRTVWLEAAAETRLEDCRIQTNIDTGNVVLTPSFSGLKYGDKLRASVFAGGEKIFSAEFPAANGMPVLIPMPEDFRTWSPDDPYLYDLELETLRSGTVTDSVSTYFGMRKVHCENGVFHLNNKPFFSRLVLDQGYDPKGLWTAPSDEILKDCIIKAQKLGFNGARLHQKLFEDRYLYWADKLGFVLWSEYPSWGMDLHDAEARENFLHEWREAVLERINHPSVIAWVPFNETFQFPTEQGKTIAFPTPSHLAKYRSFIAEVYDMTRTIDPTRPVCDSSGWYHVKTDLWTVHIYRSTGPELLDAHKDNDVFVMAPDLEVPYSGQPYFIDEWGGFRYVANPEQNKIPNAWGYGKDPVSPEELVEKVADQVEALMQIKGLQGYCYTQLMDIEQEQNGLLTPEMEPKAPFEDFYKHLSRIPGNFK